MYYEIHGSGDPLVLIHGGGSTINTSFGKVLPLFAKSFKVIAVELQAHGRTPDRDTPLSFQQDADDVAALMHELKITKASFFGFSNGGSTTLQIGIRHPGIVDKLIVASAIYKRNGMPAWFWDFMKTADISNMPQELKDDYLLLTMDPRGLQIMHDRDVQRMVTFKDWDEEYIKKITAPTLVISSDADVVRVEHAVEIFRLLPNGKLAIFPGVHGEFMGEITTLRTNSRVYELAVIIIEEFLHPPATSSN
ncbi:MAG: alpha/beta hydrolase [Flavitalea sp.]